MVDLAPGSVVRVVNPSAVVETSAPGLVRGVWLKEGPPGPPGGIQSVNGDTSPNIILDAADVGAATPAEVAAAKDRANHTGTQTSATIADFTEAAQDAVAALLTTGAQVSLTYNDAANTLQISATGADAETMRDTIGAALVGVGNIAVTVNDAGDTIAISTTATANSTDAQLRDRSTHTGAQTASTISDFAEAVRDTMGTALVAGSNVTITPNDVGDTITIAAAGGGGGGAPLLTHQFYSAADKSVTSTTLVDFDAANLAVTFTAPASGAVIIRLTSQAPTPAATCYWGLRSGTTTVAEGELSRTTAYATSVSKAFKVTGLTPSASYTYKWAGRSVSGTLVLACLTGGGALMEVISA